MSIVSAIVLFAVIWFMVFLAALPVGLRTQGDEGNVVPGTHAGAPADFRFLPLAKWVSLISVVLWLISAGVILSGWIGVKDLDWFDRMNNGRYAPAATGETDG
ncbi:MAG: DUF1467 family protein [Tranquillimonas sp.]